MCATGEAGPRAAPLAGSRSPSVSENAKSLRYNSTMVRRSIIVVSKHQVDGSRVFLARPCSVPALGITQTFGTFEHCCATEGTIGASIAPFGCVSNGARGSAVYFGRHWNRLASENAKSMRFNPLGIFIHDVVFPKLQVDASYLACLESCDGTISSKAHTFGTFGTCVTVERTIGRASRPLAAC